jgi:toxin HigB-1
MDVTFEKEYLRDLYKIGKTSDKKHRFQPDIVRKYQRCIDILLGAKSIEVLYNMHSLNYEVLRGDKADISSIRVNNQYRVEFTVKGNDIDPLITVCSILELSNHYK